MGAHAGEAIPKIDPAELVADLVDAVGEGAGKRAPAITGVAGAC